MERRLKITALEKLQMEKLVAKLYSVSGGRDGVSVTCSLDGCNHVT